MKCNLEKYGYEVAELNLSNGEFDMAIENGLLRVSYDTRMQGMWIGLLNTKAELWEVIGEAHKIVSRAMEYKAGEGFVIYEKGSGFVIEDRNDWTTKPLHCDLTPDDEIKEQFLKMAREYANSAIGQYTTQAVMEVLK